MRRYLVLLLALGACVDTGQSSPEPLGRLIGTWQVVERGYQRGDSAWTETEPGLYMFSEGYYAIQEIREAHGPRALFNETTTDAERLSAFDVFHAHSGSYRVDGDRLLVTPTLAKGPNTMAGSAAEYLLEWEADRLRVIRASAAEDERRVTVLRRLE